MKNKIEFKQIMSIPTAKDLGSFFTEVRVLAGFPQKKAGYLAQSFERRYCFGEANYQQWERGSIPKENHKRAFLGLLKGICTESVYNEWESTYFRLEQELLKKRKEENIYSKPKKINEETSRNFFSEDSSESKIEGIYESSIFNEIWCEIKNNYKKLFFLFLLGFSSVGYFLFNDLKETFYVYSNDIILESKRTEIVQDKVFEKEDREKISIINGLLVDTYVWSEKYKVPPSRPSGYIVGSYVYEGDANFYYYNDYLKSSSLQSMADKGTGFHFHGLLETKEEGVHLFELRFHSIQHTVNQFWTKDCYVSVSINEEEIFSNLLKVGQDNYKSIMSKIYLEEGVNNFDFWYSCENLIGFNPRQDYKVYRNTYVKLYLKSPNQSGLDIVKSKQFRYKDIKI